MMALVASVMMSFSIPIGNQKERAAEAKTRNIYT
jgi:hypothetical protein